MPDDVADSFSEKQLSHLFTAIGTRSWGNHAMDLRGTITIPFYRWRIYYVMLMGKNFRMLSRQEQKISLFAVTFITALFLLFGLAVAIAVGLFLLVLL